MILDHPYHGKGRRIHRRRGLLSPKEGGDTEEHEEPAGLRDGERRGGSDALGRIA